MEQFRKLTLVIAYFLGRRHVGIFSLFHHTKNKSSLVKKETVKSQKISADVLTHFRQKNKISIVPLLNYEMLKDP